MEALAELGPHRVDQLRGPRLVSVSARAAAHVPVREPKISELRALCAALDLGSISRAARLLQVSQPALSKRLRALESVAGTALLARSTTGVTPTPAGERLYRAARRLLAEVYEVEEALHDLAAWTAPVRVAASPTVAEQWLPELLVAVQSRQDRHLSVELTTANSTRVRQMIRDGRSELGLAAIDPGPGPADGLSETVIWESEVVVAVPAGHRWAQVDAIDPHDFAGTPIIRSDPGANSSRVVDAALAQIGLEQVRPLAEIGSSIAAIRAALAEGVPVLLPACVAADHAGRGLVSRRVRGLRFERRFGLLFAGSRANLTPPARALAEHLLSVAAESASREPASERQARPGSGQRPWLGALHAG